MENTPFSQQIAHLSKGTLDLELTETLSNLVKAINEHAKKGSITLTLSLKPEVIKGEVKMLKISAEVKVSTPQPQRITSHLYPTYEGDLLRLDPDQGQLDLKEVSIDKDTGEIREL